MAPKTDVITELRARVAEQATENAALRAEVAHLEESCISGFYYERVPQFSQGFPNHEVLELVTAKEVQAYVDKIEALQSESAVLKECIATLEKLQGVALIESLRAEVERLNAVIESNIDEGINKIMLMSDEQISALAGFEGRSTEDQETIARQCFEIAERRVDHMKLVEENHELRQQLAASQIEAKRLREALEEFVNGADECLDDGEWAAMVVTMEAYHICDEALSSPTSTEVLDAYVAEKVKGLGNELERERMRLAACGTAALGYFEGCCDEYKSASLDDTLRLYAKAEQLTRQRDLAVSALKQSREALRLPCDRWNKTQFEIVQSAIASIDSAIKESEV